MLVSVIIPNYNHAPYLRKRIDSVLQQTFSDFEVIILDDCSKDTSREIIESYRQNPKVAHIVFNETNSGTTFKQWLKGLALAAGEWIWIAESDDYCENTFLKTLLSPDISGQCGIRYCISHPVDENGNPMPAPPYEIKEGTYNGIDFLERYLLVQNRIPNASGVLVRKSLLLPVLTPEILTFRLAGDWLVWCRLSLVTDVYFTTRTNNYHRKHAQTVSRDSINRGGYYTEFPRFRAAIAKDFRAMADTEKGASLIKQNQRHFYRDEGYRACELIRKKQYGPGIRPLMTATFRPSFNLYFLKSALYWILKGNKQA